MHNMNGFFVKEQGRVVRVLVYISIRWNSFIYLINVRAGTRKIK